MKRAEEQARRDQAAANAQRDAAEVRREPEERLSQPATKAPLPVPQKPMAPAINSAPVAEKAPSSERRRDAAPVSFASLQRSVAAPAASDAYLSQLERLVLELNMELGRRNNEQAPTDPIEQLTQRIIELNLENLALREQIELQKQSQ